RSVSSHHARIDLASDGATLIDTHSSNGTLLNDRPIKEPMPLHAGDRIQLGYTGPTLTVRELDLSSHGDPPAWAPQPLALGIGAGVVVVSLVVLGVWLGRGHDRPPEVNSQAITQEPLPKSGESKPPSSGAAAPAGPISGGSQPANPDAVVVVPP